MKKILFWIQRFVMAYGIIMLSTFFMCLIFNPMSQLLVVSFFGRCIIFTAICLLTLLVYHSKHELSTGQWWLRTILHLLLLEVILLPLAHYWQFWFNFKDGLIYGSFIFITKFVWHLVDYGQSIRMANVINNKLRRKMDE